MFATIFEVINVRLQLLGLALLGLTMTPTAIANERYLALEELPVEVKPFVETGTQPLALSSGDLNGDGRQDFVLVLERQAVQPSSPDGRDRQRPLLVLVRQENGFLQEVRRNDRVVLCSDCGGIWGDPFAGVEVGPKTLTVSHYGGSNWRWSYEYQFNYSRQDNTWQLVRVKETSFHTSDPTTNETAIYTPPEHFGKIDLADFDPENWQGRGPK
ncbi:MAG: hypothetical protein AAFY11_08065 [Cyanobacteria bacterium J06641_5]